LVTLCAASNRVPEDDELLALHDRFLLRFVVDYVSEDFRFLKLLQARPPATRTPLSLAELQAARAEAEALAVPASVLRAITDVRRELGRKNIVASDRRYAQAVGVLRARAYIAGRDAVSDEELPFLEHVLWRDPAERAQVRDTIRELLLGYEDEVRVLLFQSRELRDYAFREWDSSELRTRAAVEAHTKIRNILGKVDAILAQARTGGRPLDRVEALKHAILQIQQEMLEPRWRDAAEVARASALNRTLLESFRDHPLLEHLRERTQLDETQAGLGTVLIGEQVLALLREERLLPRGDLLDLWDLERQEEE